MKGKVMWPTVISSLKPRRFSGLPVSCRSINYSASTWEFFQKNTKGTTWLSSFQLHKFPDNVAKVGLIIHVFFPPRIKTQETKISQLNSGGWGWGGGGGICGWKRMEPVNERHYKLRLDHYTTFAHSQVHYSAVEQRNMHCYFQLRRYRIKANSSAVWNSVLQIEEVCSPNVHHFCTLALSSENESDIKHDSCRAQRQHLNAQNTSANYYHGVFLPGNCLNWKIKIVKTP